jgi:hypothetical protein
MDIYAIELDGYGAYEVRSTAPGRATRTISGFPTWSDAQRWINEQTLIAMKIANASDAGQ